MEITPQIFSAKVMHKRLFPKENAFSYRVYYLALPLPANAIPSVVQRFPLHDLGYRDGRCPSLWVQEILQQHHLSSLVTNVMLITMPQVMGYVFNPVSFYLCCDASNALRAVICEVHNTFGEQHSYVCMHPDQRPIHADDWLEAEKLFHVSPFLERSGFYRFRFAIQEVKLGIWIDYYDAASNKQLITALTGTLAPLTRWALITAFWAHPLVTLRAIALIHWQAIRLMIKGIRYIRKPAALDSGITVTRDLTKM